VAVEIIGMHKWYGEFHVLKDINLKVMRGERIVICGPSGSGKSTLIRCINRLEEHQKGKIIVDGIELTNDLKKIDEVRREVGMVFQHFNLFPHLTILENCTLAPIWVRKIPKKQAEETRCTSSPRQDPRAGQQISGPAVGRPAAARGDRPLAVHEPAHHAVRRADLGARSGNDQGSAGDHGRPRRGRHDHAVRHPRDGLCPQGRQPGDLHGSAGQIVEQNTPAEFFDHPQPRAHKAVPQPDPALTQSTCATSRIVTPSISPNVWYRYSPSSILSCSVRAKGSRKTRTAVWNRIPCLRQLISALASSHWNFNADLLQNCSYIAVQFQGGSSTQP
jgi:general L-amino acid transport system ATP-binding protein